MNIKKNMTVFGVVLLLLVTACESNKPAEEAVSADNREADPTEQTTSGETRMYTDVAGNEIEIPTQPERVVTTQYLDAMLALGVKPVGAPSHVLDNQYLGELQEGVEDVGHPVDIEKVISLQPDLIIASNEEEVEPLSQIAPTVLIPWMYGDVYAQFREIASILNREQEAEEWITALEEKAAEGRETVSVGTDETVTIFMAYGKDTLRIYGGRNVGHMIYRSLELTPPAFIEEKLVQDPDFSEFVYENISMEMLPEYAGDRIIMLVYDDEARETGGMFHQIENSALWQNLEAVKNDKVYYVPVDPWFAYSPLAIAAALDEAIEMLSE